MGKRRRELSTEGKRATRLVLVATVLCLFPPSPSIVLVNMREVISLHVGQAGVQIGNACCESVPRVPVKFASQYAADRGALHA